MWLTSFSANLLSLTSTGRVCSRRVAFNNRQNKFWISFDHGGFGNGRFATSPPNPSEISVFYFQRHLSASIDVSKCGIKQPLLSQITNRRAKVALSFPHQRPHFKVHKKAEGLDGEGPTPENLLCIVYVCLLWGQPIRGLLFGWNLDESGIAVTFYTLNLPSLQIFSIWSSLVKPLRFK